MPKLIIKATELVDTDVNFVSLVKRGANRIPFRIMKEEDQMLDLHKIGRSLFKKADPTPEIVAAIIEKAEDVEKVAEIFKEVGLDPKVFIKSEKDGAITVAKADAEKAKNALVLKVNDSISLVIAGLKKAFEGYDLSLSSFGEVMATGGYCTSMSMASDMLRTTVGNILCSATTPEEAADSIQKACEEFKKYVVALTTALPVQAFKADLAFDRGSKLSAAPLIAFTSCADHSVGEGAPAVAAASEEEPTIQAVMAESAPMAQEALPAALPDADADPSDLRKATDDAKADAIESEASAASTACSQEAEYDSANARKLEPVEKDAAIVLKVKANARPKDRPDISAGVAVKQESRDDAKSVELLDALVALKKSMDEGLRSLRSDVRALDSRVDEVTRQVKETDAALNGTVFAEAGDDIPTRLRKNGAASAPPLLDTAYAR